MRKVRLEFDKYTSGQIGDFFQRNGMSGGAAYIWQAVRNADPYDVEAKQRLGNLLFDLSQAKFPRGAIERSRFLLSVLLQSAPTDKLVSEYFENVDAVLSKRPRRSEPGRIILGIGSGRCGSTSLCATFASAPNSCATHENPPMIDWQPLNAQVAFHLRRLKALSDYFDVVFDASHWWLNVLDRVFAEFTEAKVVVLRRSTDACVRSFASIKGSGRNSINHWAPRDNNVWSPNLWDPVYPSYPLPPGPIEAPDVVRADQIARYIEEYYRKVQMEMDHRPDRFLLLETEALDRPESLQRLNQFTGLTLTRPDRALNAGSIADSGSDKFVF